MSELWRQDTGSGLPYRVLKLVRSPRERATLHQRIEARLQAMFAAGFEDEVRALYERGDLDANLPSMRSVGYRQLWAYLSGELSWEQMHEKALAATRQLAKRQYTWLRAEQDAVWLWDGDQGEVEQLALQQVNAFLSDVEGP
jgi:tRNA dimethylallyltransferase